MAKFRGGGDLVAVLLSGSFSQRGRDTTRIGQVKDGAGAAASALSQLWRRMVEAAAWGREFTAAAGAQPGAASSAVR